MKVKMVSIDSVMIIMKLFQFGWTDERKSEFEADMRAILEERATEIEVDDEL